MTNNSTSMKKFLATATTAAIVASSFAGVAGATSNFTDVNDNYKEAVDYLVSKGIQGTSASTFGTYAPIKRVDAAVFVVKALGLEVESAPASGFTDVPGRAVKEVNALKAAKITNGKSATSFGAQDLITRGELAIWLDRAFGLEGEGDISKFNDVAPNYAEAVKALVANKITNGTTTTTFGTKDNAKRGDFALFVKRAADASIGTAAVESVTAENGKLTVKLAAAVEEVKATDFKVTQAINGKAATNVTPSNAGLSEDGKTVTLTVPKIEKTEEVQSVVYKVNEVEAKAFDVDVTAAKVAKVTALNAKQVAVQFNTALAKNTTVAQLKEAFSLEGKKIAGDSVVLSEDRKMVTYTLDSTEVENAKLTIRPLNTALKNDKNQTVQTEEYVTLFSFDDVVAPAVHETKFEGYSADGKTVGAQIVFSEELSTVGTVSLNGTQVASPKFATNTLSLAGLTVGETYTVDIVGAKDTANPTNKAEHLTLSFTVPAKEVDSTIPTVTTSTDGNKLKLTFSEEVTEGSVTIGGTAVNVNDITTEDNKTFVVDVQTANDGAFFNTNASFFTAEVIINDFADESDNEVAEVKFHSTFTADTTAPNLASAKALENGKIVLEFNEEVSESTIDTLTIKKIDDIVQSSGTLEVTSAQHPVVDGEEVTNQLELALKDASKLETGKKYTIEIAKNNVEDRYENSNSEVMNFNVVRPEATEEPGEVITTDISAANNAITIVFSTDADGMSDSVLEPTNYTVGEKVLPEGTDIQFIDNKKKVKITLPESFVSVNGNYTFTASNLEDEKGNTLAEDENTKEIALTENVAPTVNEAVTVKGSNQVVVSFSEAIQSADLDDDKTPFEGINVKVNGSTVTPTFTVDASGQLIVQFANAVTSTDKVTVELKDAELTDSNNNAVKDAIASN